MDFIKGIFGLKRNAETVTEADVKPLLQRFHTPENPRIAFKDLPLEVLACCAQLGELRTYHSLVVSLGRDSGLRKLVRDDRLEASEVFREARRVHFDYRRHGNWFSWWFDRNEKVERSAINQSCRWRAAAIRAVSGTGIFHGVASVEGTNRDHGGHETVALLSVARRAPRCAPEHVEAPRVLFIVTKANYCPANCRALAMEYEHFGVYAVLGPVTSERRARLVDDAFDRLDQDGVGSIDWDTLRDAYDPAKDPWVLTERISVEEASESFARPPGSFKRLVDDEGRVSRRDFEKHYAHISERFDEDDCFEREVRAGLGGDGPGAAPAAARASLAAGPMRPLSRVVRMLHLFTPVMDGSPDDEKETLHLASDETSAAVAERLGIDASCLGAVLKSVVLATNLRGGGEDQWDMFEYMAEDFKKKGKHVSVVDSFPRFERETAGDKVDKHYPRGSELQYHRWPEDADKRKAKDHEFDYYYESPHGLFREAVSEVQTRVDLESCSSLRALFERLCGWREAAKAALERENPPVIEEWDYEETPRHYFRRELFYSSRHPALKYALTHFC